MPIEAEERLQMSAENQRVFSHTAHDGTGDGWMTPKVVEGPVELTNASGVFVEKLLSWREI